MVRKGLFWTIGGHLYSVYYPIISYQRVHVYRFKTMGMEIFRWNNGVSGNKILVSTVVFIVWDMII